MLNNLSSKQIKITLWWLVTFHVIVIAASNYLVQLPFTLWDLHTTWGAFSFPFIFLATDLTVRIFGKSAARKIIASVMLPALLISYVISVLFQQGSFKGFEALTQWNLFVGRIALASFMAYVLGQLLDIHIFDQIRRTQKWWVAPTVSTILGNLADTFAFFSIAFWQGPDAFMRENWVAIAWFDYGVKLSISILFFLPMYGILLAWIGRLISLETNTTEGRSITSQ